MVIMEGKDFVVVVVVMVFFEFFNVLDFIDKFWVIYCFDWNVCVILYEEFVFVFKCFDKISIFCGVL